MSCTIDSHHTYDPFVFLELEDLDAEQLPWTAFLVVSCGAAETLVKAQEVSVACSVYNLFIASKYITVRCSRGFTSWDAPLGSLYLCCGLKSTTEAMLKLFYKITLLN